MVVRMARGFASLEFPSTYIMLRDSLWTAWQMATSRPLTAARLHVTSPGPACTTRCRARVTTFPRSLQTHSPARCWNWHIFDHTPPECEAPDSVSEDGTHGTQLASMKCCRIKQT